ncbi:hypothetical protein EGH51_18840 [Klebsiella aerogenes]|nr:hypothetical protein EGH51_18840 [Klebsiella aerogenes]
MSRAPLEKTYWSLMFAVMGVVKQRAALVQSATQTAAGESRQARPYVGGHEHDTDPRRPRSPSEGYAAVLSGIPRSPHC